MQAQEPWQGPFVTRARTLRTVLVSAQFRTRSISLDMRVLLLSQTFAESANYARRGQIVEERTHDINLRINNPLVESVWETETQAAEDRQRP